MAKLSKHEVSYSLGMIHSHCGKTFKDDKGYCEHFVEIDEPGDSGQCRIVSGMINPVYWCRKFEKA